MLWNEVIGQEKTQESLLSLLRSGQLPHALLLLSKEGSGGLPLAVAFAQLLLCEQRSADNQACGQCPACHKTKSLVHPDLHFTFPSIPPGAGEKTNSKNFITEFRKFFSEHPYGSVLDWLAFIGAKDRQTGNISAEECKEMRDTLSLKAMEGRYKIQIIWRPEYLGKEGNILLKLIEEPPTNTIFLLVAEETDSVLETILSRTQLVRLQSLSEDAVRDILSQQYHIAPDKAAHAALLAEGNVALALKLSDDTENDWLQLLKDWFNGVFTFNGNLISKWIDTVSKLPTVQLNNFLRYCQQMLGHAMRMSLIPGYRAPISSADAAFAQKLAARQFSHKVISKMDKHIAEAIYHIVRNANVKVVLLHLSIQLQYDIKQLDFE